MLHERQQQIQDFLVKHGWEKSTRIPVTGDASFRRYERLLLGDKKAILMDAPPGKEDVRPFMNIGEFLLRHHFSAPEIYASDSENGFLLLEDFGDDVYGRILAGQSPLSVQCSERELYAYAMDVLAELHQVAPPANLPHYSQAMLLQEASQLTTWYLPAIAPEAQEEAKEEYLEVWKQVLAQMPDLPEVLLLRDYHSPNLMWLPEREGVRKVGLLDFQDAVLGSPAYDVVSLLEDARRDVTSAIVQPLLERYLDATSLNKEEFLAAYAILGAQRNCKVIGFLSRKLYLDNNPNYLTLLPRMWRYLAIDFAHPVTVPVKAWVDKYIPADKRDLPALTMRHEQLQRA